mmetsp:Transcript_117630/g.379677  ORF Transcript_117630/g.379677 Transcript_117630/m.379677 type:complete len:202 (-) Transcript_117630:15-620(-)
MAAVARERVVILRCPAGPQKPQELEDVGLRGPGLAHGDRLAEGVPLAMARDGAEDAGHLPWAGHRGVGVAPFAAIDLHTTMEDAGAQRPQQQVQCVAPAGGPEVVDVQDHRLWRPPRFPLQRWRKSLKTLLLCLVLALPWLREDGRWLHRRFRGWGTCHGAVKRLWVRVDALAHSARWRTAPAGRPARCPELHAGGGEGQR